MKFALILFLLLGGLCFAGDWRAVADDMSLLELVERSLECSGENRPALESALSEAEPEILPGVVFMIANSPAVNLAGFDTNSLLAEIRFAYRTRELFPWVAEIGDDLFLHYVLPNQVTQEPLTYYREFFLDELLPLVDTLKTATDAAIAVNYWCGERVKFQQTQRQDQGVFQTLSSGFGRCEEMMIVHVSALRSVGIPARQAWTPYWATSDNNHAWTELYADGAWHYTGACEPRPTLDDAWFTNTSRRAAVIFSVAMGVPPRGTDIIYREREKFAIINSFPHYVESPAVVNVFADGDSVNVYLCVFNFGALRPIMRLTAENGEPATLHIGRGEFFITAGDGESFDWAKVEADFGDTVNLTLEPRPMDEMGAQAFWLRYPVLE
ncbi:MAG TPA: transglutaminase domain-containing protein [candidate division Zixibacteria bacterium]|mgnify:CR=1 FL=1|nr:transglutaminase domain-containing protein [candidate division Zixibacteria bacterium]